MATYPLLFGHAEWPQVGRSAVAARSDSPHPASAEPLTLHLSPGLLRRLEATAELEGVSWETWAVRVLSRSIDPRLATR